MVEHWWILLRLDTFMYSLHCLGLSHESRSGTGIWPMKLAPTVLQVQLEVNGFSRNVTMRKPGSKMLWKKLGKFVVTGLYLV